MLANNRGRRSFSIITIFSQQSIASTCVYSPEGASCVVCTRRGSPFTDLQSPTATPVVGYDSSEVRIRTRRILLKVYQRQEVSRWKIHSFITTNLFSFVWIEVENFQHTFPYIYVYVYIYSIYVYIYIHVIYNKPKRNSTTI